MRKVNPFIQQNNEVLYLQLNKFQYGKNGAMTFFNRHYFYND